MSLAKVKLKYWYQSSRRSEMVQISRRQVQEQAERQKLPENFHHPSWTCFSSVFFSPSFFPVVFKFRSSYRTPSLMVSKHSKSSTLYHRGPIAVPHLTLSTVAAVAGSKQNRLPGMIFPLIRRIFMAMSYSINIPAAKGTPSFKPSRMAASGGVQHIWNGLT